MSKLKRYHDKGQKDFTKKKFEKPNNFMWGYFNTDSQVKENKAYEAGWDNARKQRKG